MKAQCHALRGETCAPRCLPEFPSRREHRGPRAHAFIAFLPSPIALHSRLGQLPAPCSHSQLCEGNTTEAVEGPEAGLRVNRGQRQPLEGVGMALSRRAQSPAAREPC